MISVICNWVSVMIINLGLLWTVIVVFCDNFFAIFLSWKMLFFPLFLLSTFPSTLCQSGNFESVSDIVATYTTEGNHPGTSTSLELEGSSSLECTTSSASRDFSGCRTKGIAQYKEVFIANAAAVVSIEAPANLITLLALPYVRLRWTYLLSNQIYQMISNKT